MKRITLILVLAVFAVLFSSAQIPKLFFRFNNAQYIFNNNQTQLQFDVQIKTDQTLVFLNDFSVSFNYNAGQFGTNIYQNDNVSYTAIGDLWWSDCFGNPIGPFYGIVEDADSDSTRYSIICDHMYPNCGDTIYFLGEPCATSYEIPLTWADCLRFTLNVQDFSQPAGINFHDLTGGFWCDQNGYYSFDTIIYVNDLNNFSYSAGFDLKANLEGPYDVASSSMLTDLNTAGHVPFDQPYNVSPWNYDGDESVSAMPNTEVVDWVLVEIRETSVNDPSAATGATMISQQAGFLLSDGSIVDADGYSQLQFSINPGHFQFVVVWHRNHLAVMSNFALQQSGGLYTYDFTSGAGQVYGGINAHKEVAPGVWAMVASDGDADGNVNNTDKNNVWMPSAGLQGYLSGDYNMDAFVENADKNVYWYPNSGSGSGVPASLLGELGKPDEIDNSGYKCRVPK